jgi:hypothetical protein
MNSDSIISILQQQLSPDTISQMSQQLGASSGDTSSAIAAALPAILAGLHKNAQDPAGAASLDTALEAHDGSILNNIGSILGGAGAGGIGAAILGHVLGNKQAPVEQGVARASGLNVQQAAQVLAMLAPIVMGALGKMKQQQGLSPAELPNVLAQSTSQMGQGTSVLGGLGGLLDSNHDGQIADDVMRIGSSVLGNLFKKN